MAEYTIITRKIEVHLHKFGDTPEYKELYDQHWKIWHTINNKLYEAANRVMSHCFFNDEYEHRLRLQSPEYRIIDDKLSSCKKLKLSAEEIASIKKRRNELLRSFTRQKHIFLRGGAVEGPNPEQNSTYKVISDEFLEYIPSEILTCLNQNVASAYKENRRKVGSGERSVPSYKKGYPVPFSMKRRGQVQIFRRDDGTIYVAFPKGLEWDLFFGRDRSNNREIVERILSGEYQACNSSIQQTKNNKIFLLLVVKIPKTNVILDSSRVVGIDLGVNIPLYAAANDNEYVGLAIGSRENFLNTRMRFNAQKRDLQRSLRHSTNGGRGRAHKLQALERLGEKERNWVHLQNHIFSKEVVEYAKSIQAGVIQMENLSNFGKRNDEVENEYKFILRYWSYFELQNMIETKAKAIGIEVRYVDPYHTSQTCSFCGHYEKGQRISQSKFVCKNSDCEKGKGKKLNDGTYEGINADWNAARNIAKSNKYDKTER